MLISIVWLAFGSEGIAKIKQVQSHWIYYNEQSAKETNAINHINESMGYGGFIHYFKNYILRHDPTQLVNAQKSIRQLYVTISEYQKLTISKAEQQALLNFINDSHAKCNYWLSLANEQ